jgi:hypothetical protein
MTPQEAFRDQAVHCDALGSPSMARLMSLFAERLAPGTPVADRILGWSGDPQASADSVPLRTAGALHALVLDGALLARAYPPHEVEDDTLWAAVEQTLQAETVHMLDWLTRAPQTNEVRRTAAILPTLLHLSHAADTPPLHLIELGASGGLNLRADRFSLRIGEHLYGLPHSKVALAPDWTGPHPPRAELSVRSRTGIDLSPVDPVTAEGAGRLLAYLWPDQPDRIARTRAAIGIARDHPATMLKGDAAQHLDHLLSRPLAPGLTVIFHTVAWQYFPQATQNACAAAIQKAGERASDRCRLAHFGMETDGGRGAGLTLQVWPGGKSVALGRADFHGRWVAWNDACADAGAALGW